MTTLDAACQCHPPRKSPLWAQPPTAVIAVAVAYLLGPSGDGLESGLGAPTSANAQGASPTGGPTRDPNSVDLSDSQLASVKVEPVGEREFPTEKQAVGSISF